MENPYASPQGEIIHPSSSFTPLTWKQILFSFEGRIPRRQYWAVFGIQMGVGLAFVFIAGLIAAAMNAPGMAIALLVPYYIASLWVGLAVGVKRCHDRGRSGWFMLLGLVPIANIWLIIEILCLRGTEGPNQYGGDPT